jgi:N-succinyldiaminopimelate aminotransferase
MNHDLSLLQPYPFEKLNALKAGVNPPPHLPHIALSIGEPKHETPAFVVDAMVKSIKYLATYPTTKGLPELRQVISTWCCKRFHLQQLNAETEILPVNGTREALFAFVQAVMNRNETNLQTKPLVLMPNPFYQIYEGAAYLAGAEPYFLNCTPQNNFLPDIDKVPESVWQRCQLLFVCSPGNPTGTVCDTAYFKKLIALSDCYHFVIASDECYSELYFDETTPPAGLLQACAELGRHDYKNCLVFHSLSKRSNLPGMRSGFVAGDAQIMEKFLLYRTYHGCAMPVQHQYASIAAWQDEQHVIQNRSLYREKFSSVANILKPVLNIEIPAASFYLWPEIPRSKTIRNECEFTRELYAKENVTVLPGTYLAREHDGINPGQNRIRMALVASKEECIEAAERMKRFIVSL